jgi:hypothetical protein
VLPDANGKPVPLKARFDRPLDLMGALIRGGWIIPGEPDRSMFLVAIIGTHARRDGAGRHSAVVGSRQERLSRRRWLSRHPVEDTGRHSV